MARTSARILRLLSLLEARAEWGGDDLATRLEVSPRTLRRDVDTLRELGYPVEAIKGPGGGYRLGAGSRLPPLVLDDDQAIAIAVALQTAPATVAGIDDAVARALTTLRQVMPARLRAASEDLDLTTLRNYWEFSAPPIDVATLRAVGAAIRTQHVLRFDYLAPEPTLDGPAGDHELRPPRRVEPHHLLVWAGRWYLVAYDLDDRAWTVLRVERIRHREPPGPSFVRRALPDEDLGRYVRERADRGDTAAQWPCVGSAVLELPATLVARWAPGGSVVEDLADGRCRLVVGAWSWAGVAGLYVTFDTQLYDVQPPELAAALRQVAARFGGAHLSDACGAPPPAPPRRSPRRRGGGSAGSGTR